MNWFKSIIERFSAKIESKGPEPQIETHKIDQFQVADDGQFSYVKLSNGQDTWRMYSMRQFGDGTVAIVLSCAPVRPIRDHVFTPQLPLLIG